MGIAGRCEVYTKVKNKYYYVDLDFKKMEKKESVNDSYQPTCIGEIQRYRYENYHQKVNNFNKGSTIVITKILKSTYDKLPITELKNKIKKHIGEIYSKLIEKEDACVIKVNEEIVTHISVESLKISVV
jgi:hypothetical protein